MLMAVNKAASFTTLRMENYMNHPLITNAGPRSELCSLQPWKVKQVSQIKIDQEVKAEKSSGTWFSVVEWPESPVGVEKSRLQRYLTFLAKKYVNKRLRNIRRYLEMSFETVEGALDKAYKEVLRFGMQRQVKEASSK